MRFFPTSVRYCNWTVKLSEFRNIFHSTHIITRICRKRLSLSFVLLHFVLVFFFYFSFFWLSSDLLSEMFAAHILTTQKSTFRVSSFDVGNYILRTHPDSGIHTWVFPERFFCRQQGDNCCVPFSIVYYSFYFCFTMKTAWLLNNGITDQVTRNRTWFKIIERKERRESINLFDPLLCKISM